MPAPHSRAFPAGVRNAQLKDLPPLPVPPPLPPTPLRMHGRAAERHEGARRLHNASGSDGRKKTGGGAVFDYDHAIRHMGRSPGPDSVSSSEDEEPDDLSYGGSRSATPDAGEPFLPTLQTISPLRFGAPVFPSAPKTVYS